MHILSISLSSISIIFLLSKFQFVSILFLDFFSSLFISSALIIASFFFCSPIDSFKSAAAVCGCYRLLYCQFLAFYSILSSNVYSYFTSSNEWKNYSYDKTKLCDILNQERIQRTCNQGMLYNSYSLTRRPLFDCMTPSYIFDYIFLLQMRLQGCSQI